MPDISGVPHHLSEDTPRLVIRAQSTLKKNRDQIRKVKEEIKAANQHLSNLYTELRGLEPIVQKACNHKNVIYTDGHVSHDPDEDDTHEYRICLGCGLEERARSVGVIWDLSLRHFTRMIQSNCHYCGEAPSNCLRYVLKNQTREFWYNGLDRVVPSRGYTKENTVSCCWPCNDMKGRLSVEDFLRRIRLIAERHP